MKYKILGNRVKLIDSYAIPKAKYARELRSIRNLRPSLPLWDRSEASLRKEWALHTLLYNIGFRREKTKDCDLEFEPKWYVKLAYAVAGTVAMWIVK